MNKIDLKKYPEVSYKDLINTLLSLNFINESDSKRLVYTYLPLDAKMILPHPKSLEQNVNKVRLWSDIIPIFQDRKCTHIFKKLVKKFWKSISIQINI